MSGVKKLKINENYTFENNELADPLIIKIADKSIFKSFPVFTAEKKKLSGVFLKKEKNPFLLNNEEFLSQIKAYLEETSEVKSKTILKVIANPEMPKHYTIILEDQISRFRLEMADNDNKKKELLNNIMTALQAIDYDLHLLKPEYVFQTMGGFKLFPLAEILELSTSNYEFDKDIEENAYFIPPEKAEGKFLPNEPKNEQTLVWSLGVFFYYIICDGNFPFCLDKAKSLKENYKDVESGITNRLMFNMKIKEFARVLINCMKIDPKQRIPVRELFSEIRNIIKPYPEYEEEEKTEPKKNQAKKSDKKNSDKVDENVKENNEKTTKVKKVKNLNEPEDEANKKKVKSSGEKLKKPKVDSTVKKKQADKPADNFSEDTEKNKLRDSNDVSNEKNEKKKKEK